VDGESGGKINGNERRLLNFCKYEGLCVSSTYYKKDFYVTHIQTLLRTNRSILLISA
jgi:hypothetical protein